MTDISGIWDINDNGFTGTLNIKAVDAAGNIDKTSVLGNDLIFGFWDEPSQKITFMRIIDPAKPDTFQTYTGYFMGFQPGAKRQFSLAGTFEAFEGTGGTAQHSTFGWYAIHR